MEYKSIQFKGITFSTFRLAEKAWLLELESEDKNLQIIHEFTRIIEEAELDDITDIIPAYKSVTILAKKMETDIISLISEVAETSQKQEATEPKMHEIKICYELGLDWEEIENSTGINKNEIIKIHSSREYTVAMTGFLPGFIFLAGLDDRIFVPRKGSPRTSVPAGSVGIGGEQTGVYSLESPGGWQIIGRTAQSFFNADENPPMEIKAGDKIKFISISEREFIRMENKDG